MSKVKPYYKDQLTNEEKGVMNLIFSEIKLSMVQRLPLKTIYLQPQFYKIFEDLNKKVYGEQAFFEAGGEMQVQRVHIRKGNFLQTRLCHNEYWPMTIDGRNKNLEAIGRATLN
jgi:hypothetical protein